MNHIAEGCWLIKMEKTIDSTISTFISTNVSESSTIGQPTNSSEPLILYQVPPYLVIFLSICYGSISVLATAGNGLVIWVIIGSRRMRNVTNYYIANLALADFLLAVFAIPFEVSNKLSTYLSIYPYPVSAISMNNYNL